MALNDIGILGIIIFFFLGSAVFIPIVQDSFTGVNKQHNTDQYTSNIISAGQELSESPSLSPLTFLGVFLNVFKLAFIGVSGIPFWLDLIYSFLSIMFILILAKFIPQIGAGG